MLYAEPEDELLLLLDQSLTPLVHNVARGHHHFFYASLCVRCFHQACWCAAYHPHVCFLRRILPLFITPETDASAVYHPICPLFITRVYFSCLPRICPLFITPTRVPTVHSPVSLQNT